MIRRLGVVVLISLVGLGGYVVGMTHPALPVLAQEGDRQCFPETGKCVAGAFLRYWRTNGGLRQQGFPISDEMRERQAPPPAGDGNEYTVQYFERARFEHHPEFAGSANEVLLGLLGSEQYKARYQTPPPEEPVTLEGIGTLNTRLFSLRGGNYAVRWTASDPPSRIQVGCFHGARIRHEGGAYSESVGSGTVDARGTRTGETNLYNVPPGRYFIDVTSGCRWSITLSPQR